MISRFTIIKGIGKFQDCSSIGGRHFSKNTIIFGHNTGGKSTLTNILWSLKTGNSAIIEGRKSFGFKGNQQVELFNENNISYKFPSQAWNNGFDNIEIFDSQYIQENIFEDNGISFDQQKNLQQIIIGIDGKKLAEEINKLQDELDELTKLKTSNTNEFNQKFKKEISINDFKNLKKVDNVDTKIKETQKTIDSVNNQNKIKAVFNSVESIFENILNPNIKNVLSESIQVKVDLVTDHILKTWKNPDYPKDFLLTGLLLTKEEQDNCVFCGQKLNDSKELLNAYSKLFSVEYKKLQIEISKEVINFEKWEPMAILESIQDKLGSINLSISLKEIKDIDFKALKNAINDEFYKKRNDISYIVNFDDYDNLIQIFQRLKLQVGILKDKNIFDTDINVAKLKLESRNLEYCKIRHTTEWDDFFKQYDNIDKIQEEKKIKRETLREQLNEYSDKLFSIHFDSINNTLDLLNADFRISSFQPIKRLTGQKERIFSLDFYNGHNVSIDETAVNKPNFKNTLSYSDKRLLAFSFFYSLIIHDEKLEEKIIVLDDPFSSFDSERRTKTVELLSNPYKVTTDGTKIEKKMNQLIILTHEKDFFAWLSKKLDNPKALRIIENGLDSNGVKLSTLIDCDVFKEFIEDENKKSLKEIFQVCNSNKPIENYEALCTKCRKVLESIYTRKYLFELQEVIDKRGSIRSFTDKLSELKINDFDNPPKYNEFISLCDNLNIELHDNKMTNEGGNSLSVLADFLKLIKQI